MRLVLKRRSEVCGHLPSRVLPWSKTRSFDLLLDPNLAFSKAYGGGSQRGSMAASDYAC